MNIQVYHDLKDMLCRELEEITRKGELTAGSLDTVDKLTHSIKSIDTIIAMHDKYGGSYDYHPHYEQHSERRDRMGRYSKDDARDSMIAELRELMHDAPDEHTRKRFHSFIRELENV